MLLIKNTVKTSPRKENVLEKIVHLKKQKLKPLEWFDTPATCESNAKGHLEVEFDSDCFPDYVGEANSYEVPNSKLEHKVTYVQYTWNGDICTARGVCKDCGEIIYETKNGTFVVDTPATCESNARGHYVVTFDNPLLGNSATPSNGTEQLNTKLPHHYVNGYCKDCGIHDPSHSENGLNAGALAAVITSSVIGVAGLATGAASLISSRKAKKKKEEDK